MNADKPLTTIADRLQWVWEDLSARLAPHRLTQADFGDPLGVTGAAVGQWLSGSTKQPTAEKLFAIEDNYGYTARWIATGKGARTVGLAREAVRLAEQILSLPEDKRAALATILRPDGGKGPDGPGEPRPIHVVDKRLNMRGKSPQQKKPTPKIQKRK